MIESSRPLVLSLLVAGSVASIGMAGEDCSSATFGQLPDQQPRPGHDVDDLVLVLKSWGPCFPPCAADLNGDGVVDVDDLIQVILNWS